MTEDRPNDMTLEERVLELENENKALLKGMSNIDIYLREFEELIGERLRSMDDRLDDKLDDKLP